MENPSNKLLKSVIEGAMLYYQQELERAKICNSTTEEKETISNE